MIEIKYNPGDLVYFLDNNFKVNQGTVTESIYTKSFLPKDKVIEQTSYRISYNLGKQVIIEDHCLFPDYLIADSFRLSSERVLSELEFKIKEIRKCTISLK